jgi:hypothetical protein
VIPFGRSDYSKPLLPINVSERRDVPFGELTSPEGTAFNAMLVRPKLVRVTAIDRAGTEYEVEVPWR